jgi:uncharacterized repeat protein (TIGR03803 family)
MGTNPLLYRRFLHFIRALLATVAPVALLLNTASASTTKVIYSFAGGNDGEYLDTDLVIDSAGNLYGSTVQGGKHSSGTVFELSPSPTGWTHTVLYSSPAAPMEANPTKASPSTPKAMSTARPSPAAEAPVKAAAAWCSS